MERVEIDNSKRGNGTKVDRFVEEYPSKFTFNVKYLENVE